MSKRGSSTPHAQRSNVKNPNNSAHTADIANRTRLGHVPGPPASSRGTSGTTESPAPRDDGGAAKK